MTAPEVFQSESWAGEHRRPPHPGPLLKEREDNARRGLY
jgi:hypothetical protein